MLHSLLLATLSVQTSRGPRPASCPHEVWPLEVIPTVVRGGPKKLWGPIVANIIFSESVGSQEKKLSR